MKILLFLLFAMVFFSGCVAQTQQQDLKVRCCAQCADSFSQSPVGVGPGGTICGMFTTAKSLSTECENYFKTNQTAVVECQTS